ncbi:DUF4129 domain-containing transglutaminase family protein [Rhabdochromatium marinum]|uniref:DUF4129 domain-containing transglutaminase family protein n=1 Tax=Rhabdochromatium marinum TaxID=48729 RepID=UPI001906B962|nr:transglutaminase domain-containing protein [Rhabdochromatium marinum]MBK1650382.1 hypothetical protein [Rhabdochromatium marinum]
MNRNPPLVFTWALLLWSGLTGAWLPGIALAVWFEWALRTRTRWHMTDKSLERLVDLSSLLLLALILFEYSQGPLSAGIFAVLRWSPLLLAPLLSAQILSARPGVSYRALFLSQRRSRSPDADRWLDLQPVYLGACVLAAGVGTAVQHPLAYLGGVLVLTLWVCAWQPRPSPRRQWPLWLTLLVLVGALAWVGQQGLSQAQRRVENLAINWLSDFLWSERDPYRARTALGDIGELKLSDRVLYRVTTETPLRHALLLRTAAYDRYVSTSWFAHPQDFQPVPRVEGGWQWSPRPTAAAAEDSTSADQGADQDADQAANQWVQIGSYLPRRGQLLPLPTGTWRLSDLPVDSLERQSLGAVKIKNGPPLIHYQALYRNAASSDRPPEEADLRVPKSEQPVLQALVSELGLSQPGITVAADTSNAPESPSTSGILSTRDTVKRVRDYFASQFRYSLKLPGAPAGQTAIEYFLTTTQRGHCEFFATATVLLLRQAGVPARYAVGYSVQEPVAGAHRYRVRRSHAHAWTLYWDQGQWHDFDTTPALWAELEAEERSFWQPLVDLGSRLWYQFNLSRLEPGQGTPIWLWGLLAVLFALLAYRLRLGQRWRAAHARRSRESVAAPDSPLAPIARQLTRAGWPRRCGETDRQWLTRLAHSRGLEPELPPVDRLLQLNEQARYRPGGLDVTARHQLQVHIDHWLTAWKQAKSTQQPTKR